MDPLFEDELEFLKSSYDDKEFTHFVSNRSYILKFTFLEENVVTFEVSKPYPQSPPLISLSLLKFSNSEKAVIENEIRSFSFGLVGSPMIMDLVNKLEEIVGAYQTSQSNETEPHSLCIQDYYMAVILINHIRKKSRYIKTLTVLATDMNVCGALILYKRWIFLILQGTKKCVKEFIVQFKTSNIDVDSTGKPCKEKMAKVLLEENSSSCFSSFTLEEISNLKDMEEYFCNLNLNETFQNVVKPVII